MTPGPLRLRRTRAQPARDEGYALDQIDPRSEDARLLDLDEEAGRAMLADMFAGTDLMGHTDKVSLILRVRAEVRDQWSRARASFLTIGRALLDLDEDPSLSEVEKARLKRGSERIFPFSDAIATQLRAVARAIRDGRFAESQCPAAYSTAYHLSILTDPELEEARRQDLIRPNVPRSAVLEFRRRLRLRDTTPIGRLSVERMRAQKLDLERQIDRVKARLRLLQANLDDVQARLKLADPKGVR